jgi:hypothetical protein
MLGKANSSPLSQVLSSGIYQALFNNIIKSDPYVFDVIEFVKANELSHFTLT